MKNVHMRSYWLGAHATLLALGLMSLPLTLWALITVCMSSFCLWTNWTALQAEARQQ